MQYLSDEPQALDSTRDYELDLFGADNTSVAGLFTGAESFAATLWPGGSYPALATPLAYWLDAAADPPRIGLTITPSDLANLKVPASYRLRVTINPGTDNVEAWDGLIRLLPAAGATPLPAVYCEEADLLTYAGWLEDLQSEYDLAGFLAQRARARSWLDELIVKLWKYQSYSPQIGQPGWGARMMATSGWDPIPSKWLRDQLALDTLIVTGDTIEIVSKKAIAYICADQVGADATNPYQALGREFARDAHNLLKTYRAEVDLNADGFADLVVHCGATNLR